MSPLSTAKMTSKQYLMLGQDPPGVHLELAHGEIVVSPSPSPDHSDIVLALAGILRQHVKAHKLGKIYHDTDTLFDDENTRRPDLAFFALSRRHLVGKKALMGPPDLCIEVLSPSNIHMDREDKFALYQNRGVPHYWIVDPDAQTIEAFSLQRGKYVLVAQARDKDTAHLPPFPDLPIPLAEVWPED